jgi:hypothetical protein
VSRLNRFHFLFIFIFFCFFQVSGKGVSVGPTPEWVRKVKIEKRNEPNASQVAEGYTYLVRDFQDHIGKQIAYYHYARKIFTETGVQNASEISITYDPAYETLIIHEIVIFRDKVRINKLDASRFEIFQREQGKENHIFDGSLTAFLSLEDVRAGDVIEYSFSIAGRNPIYEGRFFATYYLQSSEPVGQLNITLIASANSNLNILCSDPDLKPEKTEEGNNVTYHWYLENIPGKYPDSDIPYWYEPYPLLSVSEFSSWKQVKSWALNLYVFPKPDEGPLSKKIKEISELSELPGQRLAAALEFVQKEIRYTGLESGIGGYKPESPSKVFNQRFGDCKGKSLLLSYMLKQLGISAYPALVNSYYTHGIKKWIPSPHAFNHCVVYVELDDKNFWYDPTYSTQKGNYDNIYFPSYGCALLVKPDDEGLVDIPVSTNCKTIITETYETAEINKPVKLFVRTDYYGGDADYQRYHFSSKILKEIEKDYLNYYAKLFPEIISVAPLQIEDNIQGNVFSTIESYELKKFWENDPADTNYFTSSTYANTLRDKIKVTSKPIRTMPVRIEYPLEYENVIELVIKGGWDIPKEEKIIEGPGIYYKKSIWTSGEKLFLSYYYKTTSDHADAEKTTELIKCQNSIIDDLGYGLSFNNSIIQEASLDPLFFLWVFLMIISGVFLSYKIYQYDPLPRIKVKKETPIAGIMILYAIGLCLSPFSILYMIHEAGFFDGSTWAAISDERLATYSPMHYYVFWGELLFNCWLFAFTCLLLALFFTRRSSFPQLLIAYYFYNFLGLLADYILIEGGEDQSMGFLRDFTILFVKAGIWASFFWFSDASKNTFTNTIKKIPPENFPGISIPVEVPAPLIESQN